MANDYINGPSSEVIVLDRSMSRRSGGVRSSRGKRGLSTARAVLKVLSFMAQHPEGVTAREVARELGKSLSTAYDLLASLCEEGFALHGPGRSYRLCVETVIGTQTLEPPNRKALSRAVDELFARTHRRSYLGRVEAGAIVITAVCGRQGIPRVPGLGPRIGASAHALAMGKVVLSLLPGEGRRRYIDRGLRKYTSATIISPAALMSELDAVRSNGFAVDRGEFDPDYCTVAAPILDAESRFIAVLGLSTAIRTFAAEAGDLVAAVREIAAATAGGRPRTTPGTGAHGSQLHPPRAA